MVNLFLSSSTIHHSNAAGMNCSNIGGENSAIPKIIQILFTNLIDLLIGSKLPSPNVLLGVGGGINSGSNKIS